MFDFATFPVIETDRLLLRDLRFSDAYHVLVFRGDPEVQKYNAPVSRNLEDIHSLMERLQEEYDARKGVTWAVTHKEQNQVIGLFGLHHWSTYHRRAEIGYDLSRLQWGQGIGSEAARALVRFGFERMNLNRIYASTIADNYGSVRILERLGFQREGTRRKHSWEEDGTFHDSAIYGLLSEEYSHLGER